jgi:hypothetical protein
MMLVDAEAIEAHLVGEFELIEIIVIEAMADFRIVEVARDIDPDAAVFVLKTLGQISVRHQVEPGKFHYAISFAPYPPRTPLNYRRL